MTSDYVCVSEGETKGGTDRVRVNDVCVSHGVLAAGGFTALRRLDPAAFHLHNEQKFQCEQGRLLKYSTLPSSGFPPITSNKNFT